MPAGYYTYNGKIVIFCPISGKYIALTPSAI
jgi:hypothetical protein